MAPREPVTGSVTWRTIELPERCGNQLCPNQPGEGVFVLLIEERAAQVVEAGEEHRIAHGPPVTLFVCGPCAAVLRGELR